MIEGIYSFVANLGSDEVWPIVSLSAKVAFVGVSVALPFALGVGYILAQTRFWGWSLLNAIVHLPLVLPPVVTGYGLLLLFGVQGPLGAFLSKTFGLTLSFNWKGAALAAAVMGFPLMVRAIRQAFEALDPKLYEAAALLGASPTRRFITLTFPLIAPGLLAAFVLGFAKALGEFGATVTFVAAIPGETQTLSSAIYALLQVPNQERMIGVLILLSIALSVGALLLSEFLSSRVSQRYRRGQTGGENA